MRIDVGERKAQAASEYQWQKDNIKLVSEQAKAEDAEREARNRSKRMTYRQDLQGQMDYEQRKKKEVDNEIDSNQNIRSKTLF